MAWMETQGMMKRFIRISASIRLFVIHLLYMDACHVLYCTWCADPPTVGPTPASTAAVTALLWKDSPRWSISDSGLGAA
jgi:hypothetical protein